MTEPKIEIKNLKTFVGMEGIGVNCDIFIDGVKCIFMRDDAQGGCFHYDELHRGYPNPPKNADIVKANIAKVDAWINAQPETAMEFNGEPYLRDGKPVMIKLDWDCYFDQYIQKELERKETAKAQRSFDKLQEHALIIGQSILEYSYYDFKRSLNTVNKGQLQQFVMSTIGKKEHQGKTILNTNLKALGIQY